MKKWIIVLVVIGLLGWAVYDFVLSDDEIAEEATQDEEAGLERGDLAPDFKLETIEGEEVRLSDYRGEKVLLNFWATWCGPCRAEMPDMQKYHEEDDDAVILAVNLTETEKSSTGVDEFLDEYGIDFTILSDKNTVVSNIYKAQALPTSYLINTEGRIHNIAVGPLNYEAMVQAFNEMD